MSARASYRIHGFDAVLLVGEIIALQALHILTLCLLVPPLLALFAAPVPLSIEGGSASVAAIMDWRLWSGQPTLEGHALASLPQTWGRTRPAQHTDTSATQRPSMAAKLTLQDRVDTARGWVLGAAWFAASMIDVVYLSVLIRRPTYILDFALTLLAGHIILTTYFSASFPTAPYFWVVTSVSAVVQIVWAEQLCIRREMRTAFSLSEGSETLASNL